MKDELTMSNINLYAVLQNLSDLCELDEVAKDIINGKSLSIQFTVKDGPKALLSFRDGKCSFQRSPGKHDIHLYFSSPAHLNKMFDGKANPIPLKGLTKISFLKNEFTKLTNRLSYFLKPTDELLLDPTYFKINTILTAYTAFYALAEIGNTDKLGRMNASRIPDGIVTVSILNGGPSLQLTAKEGHLSVTRGQSHTPRAMMTFADMETANGMLNNKLDSYTCIANETLMIKGYIPMIDNMNKLLSQVPFYLK